MRAALILLVGVAVATALPTDHADRIVGGSVTTIQQYPYAVALLAGSGNNFRQSCGGTIINNRCVLTAAHCFMTMHLPSQWRSRVGSTNGNSGGSVFTTNRFIHHPNFNTRTMDMDFSLIHIQGTFPNNNNVRAAAIAGPNYHVNDNQQVWAIGWGAICFRCQSSEQLRHVQIWTVNLNTCRQRYAALGMSITNNMLCSGWLDVGGRDQCQGDSGGPLIHNGVVVGVCSWGEQCALPRFPGVNARVPVATNWIRANS